MGANNINATAIPTRIVSRYITAGNFQRSVYGKYAASASACNSSRGSRYFKLAFRQYNATATGTFLQTAVKRISLQIENDISTFGNKNSAATKPYASTERSYMIRVGLSRPVFRKGKSYLSVVIDTFLHSRIPSGSQSFSRARARRRRICGRRRNMPRFCTVTALRTRRFSAR